MEYHALDAFPQLHPAIPGGDGGDELVIEIHGVMAHGKNDGRPDDIGGIDDFLEAL